MDFSSTAARASTPSPPPGSLSAAAEKNDIVAIRTLLTQGADINERETAWRETPLVRAVMSNAYDAAQLLLDEGADTEIPNGNSCTPLVLAVLNGRVDMVRALLEAGASLAATHYGVDVLKTAKSIANNETFVANAESGHADEVVHMLEAETARRAEELRRRSAQTTAASRQQHLRARAPHLKPGGSR